MYRPASQSVTRGWGLSKSQTNCVTYFVDCPPPFSHFGLFLGIITLSRILSMMPCTLLHYGCTINLRVVCIRNLNGYLAWKTNAVTFYNGIASQVFG